MLLAGLTALFMAIGFLIGGASGAMIAFLIAAVTNLMSYWNADRVVLTLHGAREVNEGSAPELVALVRELARNAALPMPRVYVMDNPQPNAFATGRNPAHAAVAVSTGLINMLDRDEIGGVIAHELAHIRNRDTLTMTITATIAGAISMLAQFGLFFGAGSRDTNNGLGVIGTVLMVILAPIAAMIVQMAISRSREYAADALGARISGAPDALASALARISNAASMIENEAAERAPATAHLFIVNPLTHRSVDNLFSTHPSTENRIAALQRLAREMGTGQSRGMRQTGVGESSSSASQGPWGRWRETRSRGPWG
jgi:heat shock protein HtpX